MLLTIVDMLFDNLGFFIAKNPLVFRVQARMSIFWIYDTFCVFWMTTTTTRHDTTTLKHLILVRPPPGDGIPREDLPSLRLKLLLQ